MDIVIEAPSPPWSGTIGQAAPVQRRVPEGPFRFLRSPFVMEHPKTTICFWFRTRYVRASGTQVNHVHDNVYRLHIHSSPAQQIYQWLASYFPSSIRDWIKQFFPEWSLPSQIILKYQTEGWGNEVETYAKLSTLQGVVIPRLLGVINHNNASALLMSDIGGVCLATPEGALLQRSTFRQMIYDTLAALAEQKFMQDDTKLDNFHLVGDKIMAVDLETFQSLSDHRVRLALNSAVEWLTRCYQDHQDCCLYDGYIAVDD